MVLWELLTGKIPFDEEGVTSSDVARLVVDLKRRPEIPKTTPPEYATLIQRCWAEHPRDRMEATEIVDELVLMRRRRSANETLQKGSFLGFERRRVATGEEEFQDARYAAADRSRPGLDASSAHGLGSLVRLTTEKRVIDPLSPESTGARDGQVRALSDGGSVLLGRQRLAGARLSPPQVSDADAAEEPKQPHARSRPETPV